MPQPFAKRLISRRSAALALGVATVGMAATAAMPTASSASSSQISIIQDYSSVGPASAATFSQFRALGATVARIFVPWSQIAPAVSAAKRPAGFNATDPNAYSPNAWAPYDDAVRNAQTYGIAADVIIGAAAPRWAERRLPVPGGWNNLYAYYPSVSQYGQFMTAVAKRYSGHFTPPGQTTPLPRVHFWALWNEPNFGQDLGPQATGGSRKPVAPMLYRQILNAGWKALHNNGHGHDTILVGGYAARGVWGGKYPGNFGQTPPLRFIRYLYCVDKNFKQLRGSAAKTIGCPTNTSASRRFRSQNPALFNGSGVADHPYPDNGSPLTDGKGNPDYATFPDLGNLAREMDKVVRVYGSHKHFAIYNDEYAYITSPPRTNHYLSPAKASVDINWAEYLSYKNPRISSYMQYLLTDPAPNGIVGPFASGLEFSDGSKKATFFAYNLPVWMPSTSFSHSKNVEVWGDARPAGFERRYGPQSVQILFQRNGTGAFTQLRSVTPKSNGYFDIKMKFPASGNVELSYTYPTADPLLPLDVAGSTITSRSFGIKVH